MDGEAREQAREEGLKKTEEGGTVKKEEGEDEE